MEAEPVTDVQSREVDTGTMNTSARVDFITSDPERMGGAPCITGTRFTLAQLTAELSRGDMSLAEIADDFDLNFDAARGALNQLANFLCDTKEVIE